MERFVGYLGIFMSAFFVAAGIFLIWAQPLRVPAWFSSLQDKPMLFHIVIGVVLIIYGIFRFYRAYKLITNN